MGPLTEAARVCAAGLVGSSLCGPRSGPAAAQPSGAQRTHPRCFAPMCLPLAGPARSPELLQASGLEVLDPSRASVGPAGPVI